MTDFNELPFELLHKILVNVDGLTLLRCRAVCKSLQEFLDQNDNVWREICKKEHKYSSQMAKSKCGNDLNWYHIFRNLQMWRKFTSCQHGLRKFYNFSMHDTNHGLGINYSVLPLKEAKGTILYDMSNLKYIPVAIPEKNCLKVLNNDSATAILVKSGVHLQRTVENRSFSSEAFFKADDCVLVENCLYFYNNRDVFRVDLKLPNLTADLLIHCDYDIRVIQHSYGSLYLFTDCGKIVTIKNRKDVTVKPINCPEEWIKRIKHVCLLDERNYVCYCRNLFKIETDNYRHLYLEFPTVTSTFFYGDVILIGTRAGEILLYRMSSQRRANKPIFEIISVLPEQKFAVLLDVYERKKGPLIVATTFMEVFLLDVTFFSQEEDQKTNCGELTKKIEMYKRLIKLKDKLKI